MGWWKTGKDAEAVVGDGPLDTLGYAVGVVVRQYEEALGRRPTIAEWEALLISVLGMSEAEYRSVDDGLPKAIRIEFEGLEASAEPPPLKAPK